MPIQFLATPTEFRRHIKRLITASERVDIFVDAFDDPELTKLLAAAAKKECEVNLTVNLDAATDPDAIQTLIDAGANVGIFAPATFRRRAVRRFAPGVFIFDNDEPFFTAALVGAISATTNGLSKDLATATLLESDTFDGTDEAGDQILKILNWGDAVSHTPVDEKMLAKHRRDREAADEGKPKPKPSKAKTVVEVKPEVPQYASALSWQGLRRCEWGTYWNALLEADRLRGERRRDSLCGPKGWLAGIDMAQGAFREGPEGWTKDDVRTELLGQTAPANVLGALSKGPAAERIAEDPPFRAAVHEAIEQCIGDSSPDAMRDALRPVVNEQGLSVADISRLLALAAPDRFFSIQSEDAQVRMSNVVGFDLGPDKPGAEPLQDQLSRYADAIDVVRSFPWAAELSAERSSDHPLEADAWMKRVALLGCFV